MPSDIKIHSRSSSACVASLGPFVLMRCYGAVTAADIAASIEANETCLRTSPAGVGSIVIIDPATGLPTGEDVRQAAIDSMRRTKGSVRATATALLGEGFWASALRGVLTTFDLVSAVSRAQKTTRTVEEAIDWMLTETGESPGAYRHRLLAGIASMAARPGG